MTHQEYEDKIVRANLDMGSLIAVIALMDENYFQRGSNDLGEDYWVASYDDLENITRAVLALAKGVKDTLEELSSARLDTGKETQP